jgi:hypothetical protein
MLDTCGLKAHARLWPLVECDLCGLRELHMRHAVAPASQARIRVRHDWKLFDT